MAKNIVPKIIYPLREVSIFFVIGSAIKGGGKGRAIKEGKK